MDTRSLYPQILVRRLSSSFALTEVFTFYVALQERVAHPLRPIPCTSEVEVVAGLSWLSSVTSTPLLGQTHSFLWASCHPTSLLPNTENCPMLIHWIIHGLALSSPLLLKSCVTLRDFSAQADNWLDCYFLDLFNSKGLHLSSASATTPRPHPWSCHDPGLCHLDSSNLLYGCILPLFWLSQDFIPMIPTLWPPRDPSSLFLPFPSVYQSPQLEVQTW